jgi:hypothetical protein
MSEAVKTPMGMDAFNTTTMANEGVKMPLYLPDGTKTEHFLVLRGGDSKAFKLAQSKMNRAFLDTATRLKEKKIDDAQAANEREANNRFLIASLVAGWSFEKDCSPANVAEFFESAPQIQQETDLFAGDRSNFFLKPPQD